MLKAIIKTIAIILFFSCTPDLKDYPGLKIQDLKKGAGDSVGAWSTIKVHYEGRFVSGEVFDKRTKNFSIRSPNLIEGWKVGLIGMKVGGQRRLTIPPEYAFGKKGNLRDIPPNATIIFDIDLLAIE